MVKKISIIGAGTAGCLAAVHYAKHTDWYIDWYYDSNSKPQAVGEGSFPSLPPSLFHTIGFDYESLSKIDGTVKTGIKKTDWGSSKENFFHYFPPGVVGYHFNANKLQNHIMEMLRGTNRVKLIDKNINSYEELDSDFVMDCSGTPKDESLIHLASGIPVNSAFITQCFWKSNEFNETLALARPYGWVFGIPLKNRCSIGYMFNKNINSVDEIKEDVENVFREYCLTPSENTSTLSFKNYFRKKNFNGRVCFNGNSSFFLEPLEATSIAFMDKIQRLAYDQWTNCIGDDQVNNIYIDTIKEIETIIAFHYCDGSSFDTEFWDYAKKQAINNINNSKNNFNFSRMLELSKNIGRGVSYDFGGAPSYGTWSLSSFALHLQKFKIMEKLIK